MTSEMSPADQLRAWREARGISLAKTGKLFGVSAPTVHDYENGKKRPHGARREVIHLHTGIEPSAWDTREERAFVDAAREATQRPSTPPPPPPPSDPPPTAPRTSKPRVPKKISAKRASKKSAAKPGVRKATPRSSALEDLDQAV